ncbi:hypothetical protein KCV07_g177, partial [Aureobasidium melanogenum]
MSPVCLEAARIGCICDLLTLTAILKLSTIDLFLPSSFPLQNIFFLLSFLLHTHTSQSFDHHPRSCCA